MTSNQIAWFNYMETKRANMASEAFDIQRLAEEMAEKKRHNQAKESISWDDLNERKRSNMQRESILQIEAAERARANRAQERLHALNLEEQRRANRAREFNDTISHAIQDRNIRLQHADRQLNNILLGQRMSLDARAQRERERSNRAMERIRGIEAKSKVAVDRANIQTQKHRTSQGWLSAFGSWAQAGAKVIKTLFI